MRFRKITLTLIGVLLALLCASTACFGGGNPSINMMKKVPVSSTSFDYWAIERLGDDNDLRGTIFPKFVYSSEAAQLKEVIVLANIKYAGKALGVDGSVRVFRGDFNIKDIEVRLSVGYQQEWWKEVRIWTPKDKPEYKSLAVREDTIFLGEVKNLKACIDTILEKEQYSFYEDPYIKLVADKLPDGVIINISKADSEENYPELITYGKSYSKEIEEGLVKLKLTAIYMFQQPMAADDAQVKIRDYLASKGFTKLETKQEKNFVRATALITVNAFVRSLVF
jgi:hypothetical protein